MASRMNNRCVSTFSLFNREGRRIEISGVGTDIQGGTDRYGNFGYSDIWERDKRVQ